MPLGIVSLHREDEQVERAGSHDRAVKGDAKTLKSYLKKADAIDGKKHGTAFTGTDDELDAVIAWVLQQNKAKK